jgi:hypothetical protein
MEINVVESEQGRRIQIGQEDNKESREMRIIEWNKKSRTKTRKCTRSASIPGP